MCFPSFVRLQPNECSSAGFFANPNDCKKFYRCVDNGTGSYMVYNFDCAPGTVWDQQSTVTDF